MIPWFVLLIPAASSASKAWMPGSRLLKAGHDGANVADHLPVFCRDSCSVSPGPVVLRLESGLEFGIHPTDFVSKNIHSLGRGKRAAASRAIAPGIQPLGAGHRRREFRLQALLGLLQGSGCWLPAKLGANRLWRRQSRVRISRRLAYGGFELSNVFAARTGLRNRNTEAEHRANDQSRRSQKFWHRTSPPSLLNLGSSLIPAVIAQIRIAHNDPVMPRAYARTAPADPPCVPALWSRAAGCTLVRHLIASRSEQLTDAPHGFIGPHPRAASGRQTGEGRA